MNIYYVNKDSKLKGPYDITDINGSHIIQYGDICFCDKNDVLLALLVKTANKWNSCLQIGSSVCHPSLEGNRLVYAFDGLRKRTGSIASLSSLKKCFHADDLVSQLLQNAIDILDYKTDYFDIMLFQKLLVSRKVGQVLPKDEVLSVYRSGKEATFLDYLSDNLKTFIQEHRKGGKAMRSIYTTIRKEHPKEFREALKNFLRNNPKGSIYNI